MSLSAGVPTGSGSVSAGAGVPSGAFPSAPTVSGSGRGVWTKPSAGGAGLVSRLKLGCAGATGGSSRTGGGRVAGGMAPVA